MLKLKVITLWSDLFAELDGVLLRLTAQEGANLNLLRRSVVAWNRQSVESKSPKHEHYHVSMNAQELTQLEGSLAIAYAAIVEGTSASLKLAILQIREVIAIVHRAHARSRCDRDILALVTTSSSFGPRAGLSEAVRIETFRRGLVKYQTSSTAHRFGQKFSAQG